MNYHFSSVNNLHPSGGHTTRTHGTVSEVHTNTSTNHTHSPSPICLSLALSASLPAPLSISHAQVYKAWIGGRPVAVKVQRPDLFETVALDFYLARGVADTITRISRENALFGDRLAVRSDLVAAVDEYGSRLFEELDYRVEARNMVAFRELYGSMPGVVVPSVLLDYSARRVIVTEWIVGEKVSLASDEDG